jgi:hypothetical protein
VIPQKHIARRVSTSSRLVVVPNFEFGKQAEEAGLIGDSETWCEKANLERARGWRFESWRYLDTLDRPPPAGASPDVVEAWLAREDHPFPPLDRKTMIELDSMVMFAAP